MATIAAYCCCLCGGYPCQYCGAIPGVSNPTPGSYEIKIKGIWTSAPLTCGSDVYGFGFMNGYDFYPWTEAVKTSHFNGHFKLSQNPSIPCQWKHTAGVQKYVYRKNSTSIYLTYNIELTRTSTTAGRLKIWVGVGSGPSTNQVIWESDVTFPANCGDLPTVSGTNEVTLSPACDDGGGNPILLGNSGVEVSFVRVCAQAMDCINGQIVSPMYLDPPPAPILTAAAVGCGCQWCGNVTEDTWDGIVEVNQCCCNGQQRNHISQQYYINLESWASNTGGLKFAEIVIRCANASLNANDDCIYGPSILVWYGRKYWQEDASNLNHIGTYEQYAGCLDQSTWDLVEEVGL